MVEDLRYRMSGEDTRFRSPRPASFGGFGGGQFGGAGTNREFNGPTSIKKEWTELSTPIPGESFNQAYAKARKAKLKDFTFNGKKYTTDVAPEGDTSWKGKGKVAAKMRLNLLLDENNEVVDEYTRIEPEMAQPLVRVFNKPTKRAIVSKKQQGGTIALTDEQKQELFPFFAYIYSQQLNPDRYGTAKSMEEWTSLIQESEEDINTIVKAAGELSDEDWTTINNQYMESQQEPAQERIQFAAKGAKLKQSAIVTKSKGGKTCSCGCKMLLSKEAGGKLKSTCACKCGGKMKKKNKK